MSGSQFKHQALLNVEKVDKSYSRKVENMGSVRVHKTRKQSEAA